MTREDMRHHITDLVTKYDIRVSWRRHPAGSWAIREADGAADEICIAPVKGATSYATALHEIGHIKGRHQRSRDLMVRERWAWRWAQENARIWTPEMERDRQECLRAATMRMSKASQLWRPR